jgi:predicted porin
MEGDLKKHLMTTTALIAAGLLAGPGAALAQKASKPTLTLGGWVEGIVGFADNDDDGGNGIAKRVDFDTQYDSEFHFKGQAVLDNGIRIRTRAELEGETAGDQIDEAYIAISGYFGEIRAGSEDNAAHLMVTPYSGSWATGVGQNLFFDTGDWIVQPSGHTANRSTRLDLGEADSNKITYFTPRIAGVQLGATYMPSFTEATATSSAQDKIPATNSSPHNGFAVAANFDRKFDQLRVGLGAGYAQVKQAGDASDFDDLGDPKGYNVGGSLEFQGFKVSAGYKREWNRGSSSTGASTPLTRLDNEVLDIGGRYIFGKNAVSVGYMHQEGDGAAAVAGEDETDRMLVSYRRILGPGVHYRLNFFYADYEGENAGSADDNDGYAITTSVRVNF